MSGPPQASLFKNAKNFSVTGSTINFNNHDSRSSGIHLLSQKISTSAMHDSSARDPPPRCHPDTRKAALDTIDTFVEEPDPDKTVMWMNAPFGHGKSAVIQTAIETLRASGRGHRVAGGFFFGRDKEGRDKAHYLLPAILYQVAHNIPGMYEHVNNAINADPILPSKSLEAQFIPLLVVPFLHHPTSTHTPTVFIDGLDECDTPAAQCSILKLIADVVSIHRIPLQFVVASRPEVHITRSFKMSPLSSITRSFKLDDDFWCMKDYFRKEFDKIYESRPDEMSATSQPWPSDKVVWDLADRASGQYLFASTIINFVGDEYENPSEQLKVLLAPHPCQPSAFSNMDSLYTQILSTCPPRLRKHLVDILGVIFFRHQNATIASVADLLDLPVSDVSTAIRRLRSIIEVEDLPTLPPHNTKFSLSNYLSPIITIRHLSLTEFLADKSRAGEFWVDVTLLGMKIQQRSDIVLASSISDSASTINIHPTTWKCLFYPKSWITTELDASTWPFFTREFSKYRNASLPQSPQVGCMPQTLKAFCFILEKWNNSRSRGASTVCDEDFKKTQSIVATSLHQWFGPLSQETLDLFALFTCFRPRSKETTFEAALEDIGKQSYPSFDAALCAIDSANAFVTLDQEDFPSFGSTRDARICVNSTIMDILTNPDLIGEKVYNANRSAWILALTRCYNDLLLEDFSSSSFQPKASGVFDLLIIRLDTFTLKDNIDNCHGSTMEALITRICSPESLVFLRNAAAFGHSLSRFYAPFFLFITMNCLQASVLGPHFEDIHNKLNNLIATLLEAGVLAAAFDVLELEDNRNIIIYENLFNMGKLGQGQWLNLVDDKTHTAILEFFLNTFAVGRLVSYPHGIFWTDHFSAANNSWEIRQALLSLKDDSWILEKVGPLLPESFVLGAKTWKDTHLADDLESAQAIDELCMELSSMHRASISDLNKQENSDTSENNEIGNDQDSDGVYEDMVEPDEDSDEEYEDAVEEIESETEDLSSP